VIGGVALVGGVATVVAWLQLRERGASPPKHAVVPVSPVDAGRGQADPNDPWGEKPTEPSKAFALVEDKLAPAKYRAEAAAAVRKLSSDTRFVFTAQIGELREQSATKDLMAKITSYPKVAAMGLVLPACVKGIVSDAEWLVFGAPGLDQSEQGTLILRGRWRRSDVEACFADTVKAHVAADGAKLFRIGDDGWLDFLDDHTAMVTLNTKLEAESLHKLTKKPAGPVTRVKQMLAELPSERAIAVAADGKANDDWSMLSLPKGTDVFGWVRVDPDGITLDLAADPHNAEAAKAAILRLKPQVDDVFANTNPKAVGRLEVVNEDTTVRVRGNVTTLMLGLVTASLSL
jgi:hypothetical protein